MRARVTYVNAPTAPASFADSFRDAWLPRAPLAGAVKGEERGVRRMSRTHALEQPYIEANPLAIRSLVITDHDAGDAEHMADLAGLPAPSYVVENPWTRSGHIVYALASPVCLTDAARTRPMHLLARIEAGLCDVLRGDPGYAGRITKNPLNQEHLPIWGEATALYGLRELASALDDLGALPRYERRALVRSGVGRNCALFDLVRRWSYRAWRRYATGSQTEWEEVVHAYAWDRNLAVIGEEFTRGPLDAVEVTHLARSVARWTWRTYHRQGGVQAYDQRFSRTQTERAKRSHAPEARRTVTDKMREANRRRATKTDRDGMTLRLADLGVI